MSNATIRTVGECWALPSVRRKWWLTPIVMTFVVLGALMIVARGFMLAPVIYTIVSSRKAVRRFRSFTQSSVVRAFAAR